VKTGIETDGDRRGSILLIAVFLLAFGSIFVGTLLHGVSTDLQITRNHLSSAKALYVAEAGIEHAISLLRNDFTWSTGISQQEFPAGTGCHYTVSVDNSHPTAVITSTGDANGFQKRVQVIVSIVESATPYPVRIVSWREE
jgi:type II secretory pathway component PulK